MPELRFDPLGRRHVLLAPERARRGAPPYELDVPDPPPCDFCGGREERTPPETFSIRSEETLPDAPGWRVRVVPNLYPATRFHEVVVHTPDHSQRFEDMPPAHRTDVLRAYRARVREAKTPACVVVFNRGRTAGASRSHEHGQVFGLEKTPPTLERESVAFVAESCVLCRLTHDDELFVADHNGYRVVAHPFPFVADELLVVPPCTPSFEALDDVSLELVAEVFADAIRRAVNAHGNGLPFNFVVHTAPRGTARFHWHAHLMPRTAVWGGLEMGAELPIVAADSYETARRLRDS